MTIRALIFDFDGLIVDTETPDVVVWQKIYDEHGLEFPIDSWAQVVGGYGASDFDAARHLARLAPEAVKADEVRQRHRALSDALTLTQPLLGGVTRVLDEAGRLGLRLAVASSSTHAWVDAHLQRLKLFDRFELVVCSEDVAAGRTKPHPDLYLKALECLRLPAGEAMALEDSPHGVRAARAAGLFVVVIPNPTTARLPFEGESMRLNSLLDLQLEQLVTAKGRPV